VDGKIMTIHHYINPINLNKMNTETQKKTILRHLDRGYTLTGLQALGLCGSMKLSTRISELRTEGHPISDRWIEKDGKRFKEYFINPKHKQK
jgi:hypothetical protein